MNLTTKISRYIALLKNGKMFWLKRSYYGILLFILIIFYNIYSVVALILFNSTKSFTLFSDTHANGTYRTSYIEHVQRKQTVRFFSTFSLIAMISIIVLVNTLTSGLHQNYSTHAATTFTATASGNWNIGTTWGGACAASCVAGTDYPTTDDTANVIGAYTVTIPSTMTGASSAKFATLTIGDGVAASVVVVQGEINSGVDITIKNAAVLEQKNTTQQVITGTLDVQSGGTLRHTANSTTAAGQVYEVDFSVATATIAGTVTVTGKGYQGANGTAPGTTTSSSINQGAGGAAHGGYGGTGTGGVAAKTTGYGNALAPVTIGSGGGRGYAAASTGGYGGGSFQLAVSGNLTVTGNIVANGAAGNPYNGAAGGGGSGGSIYLNVTGNIDLTGATVTANGGIGGNDSDDGGGGGGGHVAIVYGGTYTEATTLSAYGGSGPDGAGDGGAGSLYVDGPSNNGILTYDNNSSADALGSSITAAASYTVTTLQISNAAGLTIPSDATITCAQTTFSNLGTGGSLTIDGTFNPGNTSFTFPSGLTTTMGSASTLSTVTTLTVGSAAFTLTYGATLSVTALTIDSGAVMTMDSYTSTALSLSSFTMNGTLNHTANTTTESHKVNISTSGNMIVTGVITANGKGYQQLAGPGAGITSNNSSNKGGGGAAYGGSGGTGTDVGNEKEVGYGSPIAPTDLGSGGGRGYSSTASGGRGGGAIILTVSGTLTVSGSITANGNNGNTGTDSSPSAGGAGSGGSIYLNVSGAVDLTDATITANGGDGYDNAHDSGGGGGGRIAIIHNGYTAPTTLSAYGGAGPGAATTGGTGSIFIKGDSDNGALTYDNNNSADNSTSILATGTNATISTFTLSNAANIILPDTAITSVTGTTTINSGTTLTLNSYTNSSTALSLGTLTIDGTLTHADHTTSNASLAHKIKIAATTVSVGASGTINVNGLGFAGRASNTAGLGTGGGGLGSTTIGGGGGGHGGAGGNGSGVSGASGAGGSAYDTTTGPIDLGSSGGSSSATSTGDGGGAVEIVTTGTFTLAGSITANGANGSGGGTYGAGGGAGGSIYLDVATFTGAGSLTANGGSGVNGSTTKGGGGGGGIIYIRGITGSSGYTGTNAQSGGSATSTAVSGSAGSYAMSITPVVSVSSATQQVDDGYVNINYTLTDGNADAQALNIYEYSTDNSTWNTMTAATGDVAHSGVSGLSSSGAGAAHTFAWNACANISVYDTTVYARLRVNDGTNNSATAASTAFTVDCAVPTVASVTASQNAGAGTVTFTYTLSDDNTTDLSTALDIDNNGGAGSWSVTDTTVSGNIGSSQSAGSGKSITWTASADASGVYNTAYRVRLRATDKYQNVSSYAQSADFTLDTKAPTGLGSFGTGTVTSAQIPLSWIAATEDTFNHSEVWYGTDATAVNNRTATEWDNDDDSALSTLTTTTTTITGLAPATTYYFKIWAIDNFNNEQTVSAISATTTGVIPSTPSGTSPTSGQTNIDRNPTFTGNSYVGGQSSTHLSSDWQISDNNTFSDNDCSDTNIVWCKMDDTTNKTSIAVNSTNGTFQNALSGQTQLWQNTQYYYRTRHTSNTNGDSAWSTALSFTTSNTAPTFIGTIAQQSANEDTNISSAFDLDDYFADVGDTLTYSAVNGLSSSLGTLTINSDNTVSFIWVSNASGTDTIQFRATDSQSGTVDSNMITVTLSAVNDAPTANAGSDQTSSEDTATVTLNGSASSDTEGTNLTYSWSEITDSSASCSLSNITSSQPSVTFLNRSANYTCVFRLTVSDGSLTSTDDVTLNVTADNDAPTITTVSDQTVTAGQLLTFTVTASDVDTTTLVLQALDSANNFTAVNLVLSQLFTDHGNTTGTFSWTPTNSQTGSYQITFQASDGTNTITDVMNITVSATTSEDDTGDNTEDDTEEDETDTEDPITLISELPNFSIPTGTSISAFNLNDYFQSNDNSVLSFSVTGNERIEVDIATDGAVTITVPDNFAGTEILEFIAEDEQGETIGSNEVIIIVEPNLDNDAVLCGTTILDDIGYVQGTSHGRGRITVYDRSGTALRSWTAFLEAGVVPRLTHFRQEFRIVALKYKTGTTVHVYDACGRIIRKQHLSTKLHWRRFDIGNLDRNSATKEIVVATQRQQFLDVKVLRFDSSVPRPRFMIRKRLRVVFKESIQDRQFGIKIVGRKVQILNEHRRILASWRPFKSMRRANAE